MTKKDDAEAAARKTVKTVANLVKVAAGQVASRKSDVPAADVPDASSSGDAHKTYRMGYAPSEADFSDKIDMSDPDKFIVTGTVTERELRDAYLEWCMRRHGSQTIVAALAGISTKSIYNRIKKLNGRG